MVLVAGVDSSTQSCKVVIRDAASGELVRSGAAQHPDGTEVHPEAWWQALKSAVAAAGGLDDVSALAVGGQQHGMVTLDSRGEVIRPALLWNDTRSAGAARDLIGELGLARGAGADDGPRVWAQTTGSVPVASLTVTKLRWLADHEPENAARVAAVALPHDWLTWKLLGSGRLDDLATDRSDASGTGYFTTAGRYDRNLLDMALRRDTAAVVLPRVCGPSERVGAAGGLVLGPGCGDNAGAALGLGMTAGDISISIGTSGVVAAVTDVPVADPSGTITGFADATGRYLPLAVTLNGSQSLDVIRDLLSLGYEAFDDLVLAGEAGAQGLTLVPYYQGERTPNLPTATGSLLGMTQRNLTAQNLARASVEGLLCGLADGLEAFRAQGVPVERIRLIGGGARSRAVQRLAPAILGQDILVPEPGEYVADGAARQAAWVLSGELPTWETSVTATATAPPTPQVRQAYAARRDLWAPRPA